MKPRSKSEIKLRKRVAVYAKEFTARLYAGKIPAASHGNCWGCLMVAEDGTAPMGGASHIMDHMRERYYVPSLAIRALTRFGSPAVRNDFAVLTTPADQLPPGARLWFGPDDKFLRRQIYSAIKRYCLCELGLIYKGRKWGKK